VKSYLGSYLKGERLKQKLNTAQLAEKIGYRNINKGMRRILDLEREGEAHCEVLEKIIDALELDRTYIDQLIQEDKEQQRREFEEWVNTPIDWHLIIRWMPAVYGEREIPGNIKTEEEAIEYAKSVAGKLKLMVWLVLSRKENLRIDADGSIKSRNEVTLDSSWLPATVVR